MKIVYIDIQNFRKLKACRVDLADQSTIFVGANNSGKTSAMDALIMFLKRSKRRDLSTTDVTLSNWSALNEIANDWITTKEDQAPNLSLDTWRPLLPTIDIWLHVDESQIHYVSHILPTLDWDGGLLGVRLILEPKDMENLYKSYITTHAASQETLSARKILKEKEPASTLTLWPTSMRDFLDRKLHDFFSISAYVLDPARSKDAQPQPFTELMEPLEGDPFDGLFKIDIINAQRGFSDPNAGEGTVNTDRRLSSQLRHYFDKHLDPTELPEASDLDALEALEAARTAFDQKLKTSFSAAIGELERLNYPGFSDPQILLSSKVNPLEGLNHDSAVQFKVACSEASSGNELCLPEKYNGLGYQNLISMIFNLIRFRDEWMRVGKVGKREEDTSKPREPLHLMLIEEPEAHLHVQVQQVFIKKAYNVLRNHPELVKEHQFTTQMVVSTHSSHIAHETDFTGLRYFRRKPLESNSEIPCASVINMTTTFSTEKNDLMDKTAEDKEKIETAKFATRYLKTTHCDLFFADAVILVEGPAERLLIPHFIRHHYSDLDRSYISLLEIGGSHAHRLRPLIEALGIPTLVITDLDSIKAESSGKVRPATGKDHRTGNNTLKSWVPKKTTLDEVLAAKFEDKITSNGLVRVAYPCVTSIQYDTANYTNAQPDQAIPYTLEDALVLDNISLFKALTDKTGLIKKMADAVNKPTLDEACQSMFDALDKNAKKAEMALELLYTTEPSQLNPPKYIADGLDWLKNKLVTSASLMNNPLNTSEGE
ncbi:recombination protein F [Legionella pneumophila]|uniref:AAA family ATPase n=1 Tax=Legionella pneumophila TaxID=446 RepID=UPI0007708EFE|nr:AAA family ATPase [Legionella pneumophila]CZH48026.1 recombination protein F [Legionella pneumophila]